MGVSPSVAITIVLSAIELRLFLGLHNSARALSNNLVFFIKKKNIAIINAEAYTGV